MKKHLLVLFMMYIPVAVNASDICTTVGRKSEFAQTFIPSTQNAFEVISHGRLHFYGAPDKSCQIKNQFLVPGDIVTGYTVYNGYASVSYSKNGSWPVEGWLDLSQLKSIISEQRGKQNSHCELVAQLAKTQNFSGGTNVPKNAFATANKSKVIFYTAPDTTCLKQDTFIVKGDNVYALKKYADYVLVQYLTAQGARVTGWVSESALKDYRPYVTPPHGRRIDITDFIAVNQSRWIGIGSSFDQMESGVDGQKISSGFIGDAPGDNGEFYKFSAFEYKNMNVVLSNVNYGLRGVDIDGAYIISAINLSAPTFVTARGVRIGDTAEKVLKSYLIKPAQLTDKKIEYSLNDMYIDFTLKNENVSSIEMGIGSPFTDTNI